MKKIIYVDMDDTIANFYKAARCFRGDVQEFKMWDSHFFLNLEPIPGSKGAIFDLQKLGFDVYILTQPLAECPDSYTDKAKWIQLHFPTLYKKIVMTQDKGLNIGHYLIDDNKKKWMDRFEENGGKFVHYPYDHETRNEMREEDHVKIWRNIVEYFKKENPNLE